MDRNRVQTETENNGVWTETGKLRTEAECREKRRNKDRSGDARNSSEGQEC